MSQGNVDKNVINISDNGDDADVASVKSLNSSSGLSSSLCSQGETMTHDQPQLCDTAVLLSDSKHETNGVREVEIVNEDEAQSDVRSSEKSRESNNADKNKYECFVIDERRSLIKIIETRRN